MSYTLSRNCDGMKNYTNNHTLCIISYLKSYHLIPLVDSDLLGECSLSTEWYLNQDIDLEIKEDFEHVHVFAVSLLRILNPEDTDWVAQYLDDTVSKIDIFSLDC